MKLQKILYLSQGWSYVWDDRELFLEEFEAWKYGPVNLEVYQYFKKIWK
ncbi:type II toxin-antitoxin system antitoxin SocA domain-containing protein [Anaerobutyricum hallii]